MIGNEQDLLWVIAEPAGDEILPVCLELIGHARKLADDLEARVEVILLGSEIDHLTGRLISAGADLVYLGNAPDFDPYQPDVFTESITALAMRHHPQVILIGSTFMGRELAPLLAAKLRTGLTAHCTNLVWGDKGVLEQQIPAYGGIMTIICPEKRPQIATVARGVFPLPDLDRQRAGEIVPVEVPKGLDTRVKTLKIVHSEPEGVPLETAPLVIAGGAGAGSFEGWQEIQELAETLKAGFGSTRPAVDEGWTDLETMIGQSGKMVSPEVYIGIGLSGEQQHMVGISGAKTMIAINNDPKAPVFDQVDYGIIADCRVFVPALVRKLNELRESSGSAAHDV